MNVMKGFDFKGYIFYSTGVNDPSYLDLNPAVIADGHFIDIQLKFYNLGEWINTNIVEFEKIDGLVMDLYMDRPVPKQTSPKFMRKKEIVITRQSAFTQPGIYLAA
jgi:hypothetical protein